MKIEDILETQERTEEEDKLINEFIDEYKTKLTVLQKVNIRKYTNEFLEYVALKHNMCLQKSDVKLNC